MLATNAEECKASKQEGRLLGRLDLGGSAEEGRDLGGTGRGAEDGRVLG